MEIPRAYSAGTGHPTTSQRFDHVNVIVVIGLIIIADEPGRPRDKGWESPCFCGWIYLEMHILCWGIRACGFFGLLDCLSLEEHVAFIVHHKDCPTTFPIEFILDRTGVLGCIWCCPSIGLHPCRDDDS
jgi:hypothetical protein